MRGIQCKRCFFFTPEWCPKKRDSLDPDLIRDCQYFKTKTNADLIRAMTDEELAEMLNHAQGDGYLVGIGQRKMSAYGNWLEWLKEEREDN